MGHGNRISVGIDDADMGRVLRFLRCVVARDVRDLAALDGLGLPARVALVEQVSHRHLDKPRVADVTVLVDGRPLHGLRHHADVIG